MSLRGRLGAAFLPPAEEEGGAEPLSERGWRATVVGMHVISAALWALAVATAVADHDGGRLAAVLVVLATLALAYVLAGAPALTGSAPVRAVAYLSVLVAGFGVLGFLSPALFFLLSLPHPQIWFVVHGGTTGVAWTVLLTAATATGPLVRAVSGDAPTARELEVLAGVARGLTNAEISWQLFIGEATVNTHLLRVFAKLGVDDRTRAVMVAVERGLLPGPGGAS